jgi:hypothetical protein
MLAVVIPKESFRPNPNAEGQWRGQRPKLIEL